MNPDHPLSIHRITAIRAAIRCKGMTAKQIAVAIHLNIRSTQIYLTYLESVRLIYVEDWLPCKAALSAVYRSGKRASMPKPAPATRTQHHRTYRAKLVRDPDRHDLHLAKRRARAYAKKAKRTPNTWLSALGGSHA